MCLTWEFWFGSRTHSGTEREGGGMILIQELFWWTEPEVGWKAMRFVILLFVCLVHLLVLLLHPLPQPFLFPLNHYTSTSNEVWGFFFICWTENHIWQIKWLPKWQWITTTTKESSNLIKILNFLNGGKIKEHAARRPEYGFYFSPLANCGIFEQTHPFSVSLVLHELNSIPDTPLPPH